MSFKNVSFGIDGTKNKRKHYLVSQAIIPSSSRLMNFCLSADRANATCSDYLAEHVQLLFNNMFFLCCDDPSSGTSIAASQKPF